MTIPEISITVSNGPDGSQAKEYARHFFVDNLDELLLKLTDFPARKLKKQQHHDYFYCKELTEEDDHIWIKKRSQSSSDGSTSIDTWSVKFFPGYHSQDLKVEVFTGPLEALAANQRLLSMLGKFELDAEDASQFLLSLADGKAAPFLHLYTQRMFVERREEDNSITACWIDSTTEIADVPRDGDSEEGSYDFVNEHPYAGMFYVSCGMRYTTQDRAEALWAQTFGPSILPWMHAPSKALVFAELHARECKVGDYFLSPVRTLRPQSPFCPSSPLSFVSLRDWSVQYVELQTGSFSECFSLLLSRLDGIDIPAVLSLPPAEFCVLLMSSHDSKNFTRRDFEKLETTLQQALAGLYGLLHLWRMPSYLHRPLPTLLALDEPHRTALAKQLTLSDIYVLRGQLQSHTYLAGMGEGRLLPEATALQQLIDALAPLLYAMRLSFRDFQNQAFSTPHFSLSY